MYVHADIQMQLELYKIVLCTALKALLEIL